MIFNDFNTSHYFVDYSQKTHTVFFIGVDLTSVKYNRRISRVEKFLLKIQYQILDLYAGKYGIYCIFRCISRSGV